MKRLFFLLCLACFFLPSLFPADIRVVINSGHTGAVRSLDVDERENLLFSCGDDGTVRAWDTDTRKLVNLLQISHNPILKIVLHPVKPHVAAIQKSGINSYLLTVWNWKKKTELYRRNLEELPLYIDYSPGGSYLVYAKTSYNSLTFLQGDTGRKLPYLSRGFGIVSHFAISPSENTILTYSSSGRIDYYDIKEGEQKYSFTTIPDLEKIEFTANLRFMAAADGNRFLLIDLTNGNILAEADVPELTAISANSLTGDFMYIYPLEEAFQISIFNFASGELEERQIGTAENIVPGTGIFHINTVYVPEENGGINYYTVMSEPENGTIEPNTLAPVSNLAFSDSQMAFAAGSSIFLIDSDFFLSDGGSLSPSYFEVSRRDTPYAAPLSVAALRKDSFLVWQRRTGTLASIPRGSRDSPERDEGGTRVEAEFDSDLLQVTPYEEHILTLENSGTCSLLDPETLKKRFTYAGFGIKTAALAEESIFLGKSRASGFNASILNVNHKTGETVPVFDSSFLIYEAQYHTEEEKVYALAVERDGNATRTVLKSFRYPSFTGGMELLSYKGEDLTAHITLDPDSSRIYTTLGFSGVTEVSRRSESMYRQQEHIPRRVFIYNDFLYTINTDYSISVWEKNEKERIMNFYMFRDLEWIALLANGEYYASPGAGKYIGVYDGTERLPSYRGRALRIN